MEVWREGEEGEIVFEERKMEYRCELWMDLVSAVMLLKREQIGWLFFCIHM